MADYDITTIDTEIQDAIFSSFNSVVRIDDTHFILAYQGSNEGNIKTFSCDSDGDNITLIDSFQFLATSPTYLSFIMIDTTHYALAYAGDGTDGFIKTFSIDGSYDNIALIDTEEHDAVYGEHNSLVKIDSTHLALAYRGEYNYGYIKTFSIDSSADNITQIDSLQHDTICLTTSLVLIDSTHLALAYRGGASYYGYIKTFSFDGSYDNITQIDSLEHDTRGQDNSLLLIDSTHLILACTGPTYAKGSITTFSIDSSQDNITLIDRLEHEASFCIYSSLAEIDSTHFVLGYAGAERDGHVKTFSIDGSYDNITQLGSSEHDEANGTHNSIKMLGSDYCVLAYTGDGADGTLKTFSIAIPSTGTNTQINIGDDWKEIDAMKINIGDSWKVVAGIQQNISDTWKTVF